MLIYSLPNFFLAGLAVIKLGYEITNYFEIFSKKEQLNNIDTLYSILMIQ